MTLQLIEAAAAPAVSLDNVKAQLHDDNGDQDDLLTIYLEGSISEAEHRTGRALMPQKWRLSEDSFPAVFVLSRVPAVSIVSITYVDLDGVTQTLPDTAYTLDNSDDYGVARVHPAYGQGWPSARCAPNAVQVTYLAGYEDEAHVPSAIRNWILLQVAAKDKNREAEGAVQTYALGSADRLLDRYKVWGA
jgi:uncharacterized phiE125 gp8 family phage protein